MIINKLKTKIKTIKTETLKNIIKTNDFKNIGIRCLICEELENRIGANAFDSFLDSII